MMQRLFAAASALSLLVFVCSATSMAIRPRQIWGTPRAVSHVPYSGWEIGVAGSHLYLGRIRIFGVPYEPLQIEKNQQWRLLGVESDQRRHVLATGDGRIVCSGVSWQLLVPLWWFAGLSLPLPLLWLAVRHGRRTKRTMAKTGLCSSCGYDLRASKDKCPECGTPVTAY